MNNKITLKEYLGYENLSDMQGKYCLVVKEDEPIYGMLAVYEDQLYVCNESDCLEGKPLDEQYKFGFPNSWVVNPKEPLRMGSDYSAMTSDGIQSIAIVSQLPLEMRERYGRPRVKLNDSYTAELCEGYVQVGCQKIPNEVIKELYKKLNK